MLDNERIEIIVRDNEIIVRDNARGNKIIK